MKKILVFALTFCLLFGSVLSVSAADEMYSFNGYSAALRVQDYNGNLKDYGEEFGPYIVMFKGNGTEIFVSNVPFNKSNGINLYTSEAGHVYKLTYNSYYKNWTVSSDFDVSPTGTINGYSVDILYWANYNIYDNSGSLVVSEDTNFITPPRPLHQEVELSAAEALQKMEVTMGGMMKVLVPCGVGCLALLMLLKLFGKRSLIFRN